MRSLICMKLPIAMPIYQHGRLALSTHGCLRYLASIRACPATDIAAHLVETIMDAQRRFGITAAALFLLLGLIAATLPGIGSAVAQGYTTRPIKLVVPSTAG